MRTKTHSNNKLSLFFVVLLLVYLSYTCFAWTIAEVLSSQVRHQLIKAQTIGVGISTDEWNFAHEILKKVLWLHPNYPDYIDLTRLFYTAASFQPTEIQNKLKWTNSEELSLDFARQLILIRPSWPYYWRELVLTKVEMDQFDNELAKAIERSTVLGPWEESILYSTTYVGTEHWVKLPPSAYQWVLTALNKVLQLQPDAESLQEELESFKSSNSYSKICQYLQDHNSEKGYPQVSSACGLNRP